MIKTIIPAILIALIISTPGNVEAKTKSSDEWLKENEKTAEENPDSFIEKAYLGANIIVNDTGEFEVASIRPGSPADEAGINAGDVVVEIEGEKIKSRYRAFKIYFGKRPNDFVNTKIKRGNKLIKKRFQLGSFHVSYINYVLMELIYKETPVYLAVIVDNFKSEKMNEQDAERWKSHIASYWIGSFESSFIKAYRGHNNFAIIDRAKIKTVLSELSFQGSGFVAENRKLGRLVGATHLFSIDAMIIESTRTTYLTMRLVEVESGKVIASVTLKSKFNSEEQQIKTKDASLRKQEDKAAAFAFGAARAKELFGVEDVTKLTPEQEKAIITLGQQVIDWQEKNDRLYDSWEDAYKLMKQDEWLKQVRAEGIITDAPKSDPPRGKRFIRSINAEISEIKFYEFRCKLLPIIPSFVNPFPKPPVGERNYDHSFSKNAKCIFWEMKLNHPKPNQIIYYQVHCVHYRPNGTELFRTTSDFHVLENWTSSWLTDGIFMKGSILSYGEWDIGTHRVDFYVEGEKVASETFEIY